MILHRSDSHVLHVRGLVMSYVCFVVFYPPLYLRSRVLAGWADNKRCHTSPSTTKIIVSIAAFSTLSFRLATTVAAA